MYVVFELLEIKENGKGHCIGQNINLEKTRVDQSNFSGWKLKNKGGPLSPAKLFANSLVNDFSRE